MIAILNLKLCPVRYIQRQLPFLLDEVADRNVPLEANPTIDFQCRFKWESMDRRCWAPKRTTELQPLVRSHTTDKTYVSIHQISGLSASRTNLSCYPTFASMARDQKHHVSASLSASELIESIENHTQWLTTSNDFAYYPVNKELYWLNSDASHRFAALRALCSEQGRDLLLPARIRSFQFDADALHTLLAHSRTFLISLTDVEFYTIIEQAHKYGDTVSSGRYFLDPGSTSNNKVFKDQRNPMLLTFSHNHYFGKRVSRALEEIGYRRLTFDAFGGNPILQPLIK